MRKILVLSFLFNLLLYFIPTSVTPNPNPAYAQGDGCAPINISQNDGNDDYWAQIAGNNIAFEGHDGNDWEAWFYDLTTGSAPLNISDDDDVDAEPKIGGNYIVWGRDGTIAEIYLYDIMAGGSPLNISNNSILERGLWTDGVSVVWQADIGTEDWDIFFYDISLGGTPTNISNTPGVNDSNPYVNGNYVVWSGSGIEIYDIGAGSKLTPIISNTSNTRPRVDGDVVVWNASDGNDTEIWLYDISEGGAPLNISQNDNNDDDRPQIDGNYVVWQGWNGNDWEIYLYDISLGGTPTNISQNASAGHDDTRPQIDGNYVVWEGWDGNDFEIYLYDISLGGSATNISQTDGLNDKRPQVDGNTIGWDGWDGNDNEIWIYQPCLSLSQSNVALSEGNAGSTSFDFTVTLSFNPNQNLSVDYTTNDGSATLANNDYIDNDGILNFTPGSSLSQTITVDVNGDTDFEPDEYFSLTLESSTQAFINADNNLTVGTILNDDAGTPNDALVLFEPTTSDTGIYDSVQNNPNEYAYTNTPPTNTAPEWVMGDWNGNGEKTPGYFDSGAFRYTNDIGPSTNWSTGFWLGNPPSRGDVVAGRYASGFPNDNGNDCIGWVDSNTNGTGDLRFSLKYWCDMTTTPQSIGGTLATQWLAAVLSDSQGFSGTHQWVYGDWDNDSLDEPGVRRGEFITRSTNAPSEGAALYGAGMAQRWAGTGGGIGPGGHGFDDGVFVAGDWDGDGTDTWGVVYDDDTFYYRDVFGFNPGPFEFASQTFTSSISAPRQVDSHHNASGGSSSPAPAFADGLVANEAINPASVDTSRNVESDLSVSKAGNYTVGEAGLVGDSIVWTITVSNTGTAPANGIQIIDNVPTELRVDDALSDNGTISVRGQVVTFTAESIGVGETIQFQVVTAILSQPSSGIFANSVSVIIPDGDGSGSDANLVASGSVESVDNLPATGYAPKLRW